MCAKIPTGAAPRITAWTRPTNCPLWLILVCTMPTVGTSTPALRDFRRLTSAKPSRELSFFGDMERRRELADKLSATG